MTSTLLRTEGGSVRPAGRMTAISVSRKPDGNLWIMVISTQGQPCAGVLEDSTESYPMAKEIPYPAGLSGVDVALYDRVKEQVEQEIEAQKLQEAEIAGKIEALELVLGILEEDNRS